MVPLDPFPSWSLLFDFILKFSCRHVRARRICCLFVSDVLFLILSSVIAWNNMKCTLVSKTVALSIAMGISFCYLPIVFVQNLMLCWSNFFWFSQSAILSLAEIQRQLEGNRWSAWRGKWVQIFYIFDLSDWAFLKLQSKGGVRCCGDISYTYRLLHCSSITFKGVAMASEFRLSGKKGGFFHGHNRALKSAQVWK